eukprot:TRINITY_DN3997_c0_g4_i10.p1 TRINITY_DN3997_c0_g4~~TRINITY_DN3997_c0_g4_i10.p1  ORF type:complete len:190 (-),score=65.42 TRINITY_DN3997_c0_g4_i10:21-590(-)
MGNSKSGLKKEDLENLVDTTHYTKDELKTIYKQFTIDAPEGTIDEETFRATMAKIGVVDQFLQDLVFSAFDDNGDGSIDFQEFIVALSVMTRGAAEEKLEFTFSMYDLDGNGYITKKEMQSIMESFFKFMGKLVTMSGEEFESPQEFVDHIFSEMDENNDGMISLDEYKQGALKNPDIVKGLNLLSGDQ